MIVARSRGDGAATNYEIALGDRGAAAPEGRGRFLDADRSRAPMVADPMVRRAQLGHVAAPTSLLALANSRQTQVTGRRDTYHLSAHRHCSHQRKRRPRRPLQASFPVPQDPRSARLGSTHSFTPPGPLLGRRRGCFASSGCWGGPGPAPAARLVVGGRSRPSWQGANQAWPGGRGGWPFPSTGTGEAPRSGAPFRAIGRLGLPPRVRVNAWW